MSSRIKITDIQDLCEKLYPNELEAQHQVSEKAYNIIQDAFLKSPGTLSGKKSMALISAAVYISGVMLEFRKTQTQIKNVGGSRELTIYRNYRMLKEVLDLYV